MRKGRPYPRRPPSRFWVDIRTPFQTRLKQAANELDDTPGRPPSAGRRHDTQASSIRGGRCVRSHIGRQSRLTCPGKTAAQPPRIWPGEGLSRDAIRLTDRPRDEPRCVSFRRGRSMLDWSPSEHPLTDRVRLRQSIYVRMNEPA